MKPIPPRPAMRMLGFVLLCAAAAPAAQAMAIPTALAPAAHERLSMHLTARGVQIYECRAQGSGHAWTFIAPEAELFDSDGRRIGSHGAGPHWQFSDGSHVSGHVKARADAPRPRDIPWLLLDAKATQPRDRLAGISSIQRVNTAGGQAAAEGCNAATAGHALHVPYTADYLFYGR